jgi:hypothetical protein
MLQYPGIVRDAVLCGLEGCGARSNVGRRDHVKEILVCNECYTTVNINLIDRRELLRTIVGDFE